jgi:hypothetical protein
MNYLTDPDYLRDCRHRARVPSPFDYEDYRCELAENEPDDWGDEDED